MADNQITPFQLTDQFTMDNFNQRINETNIALQSKPNPNLLDNWYFANPVDQRGGYVVPPGVTIYRDADLTNSAGTTSVYNTVKLIERTENYDKMINDAEQTVYAVSGAAVRGYTGTGYGIDRWKQLYDSTYCLIQDGYVSFYGTDFGQMIETKIIPLNTPLTYSVLTAEGILGSITFQFDGTPSQTVFQLIGETKFRANFIYNWGNTYTPFFLQTEGNVINVVAMKLELGNQQTLAHQENGNWVLNEIPDYGEQLRRCQYHFRRIKPGLYGSFGEGYTFATTDGYCYITVPYEEMRTTPAVSISSYSDFGVAFGGNTVTPTAFATENNFVCKTSAHLSFAIPGGSGTSKPCSLIDNTGNAYIDLIT